MIKINGTMKTTIRDYKMENPYCPMNSNQYYCPNFARILVCVAVNLKKVRRPWFND
jgi:hypothetical protein